MFSFVQEKYGQLYAGDCYVMLYTYLVGERESYIIYFWQVRASVCIGLPSSFFFFFLRMQLIVQLVSRAM